MSAHYTRLVRLLEKWPVDATKPGRDLGEHLRKKIKPLIESGSKATTITDESFLKQIQSVERLSNDIYLNKYKRLLSSTSTGLNGEQCRQVTSSEFLEYLNDDGKKKN